jgi:hypothetical protein
LNADLTVSVPAGAIVRGVLDAQADAEVVLVLVDDVEEVPPLTKVGILLGVTVFPARGIVMVSALEVLGVFLSISGFELSTSVFVPMMPVGIVVDFLFSVVLETPLARPVSTFPVLSSLTSLTGPPALAFPSPT